MKNKDIAEIFLDIADILELKEENMFKIRAYRRAAQNIKALSQDLSDIYSNDPEELDKIPGIGKDLKARIIELITTGGLVYFSELKEGFPDHFLDLLDVSGLGPKKLRKLNKELNIEDLDGLERACKKGWLEDVEGMGKKTQKRLLESISYYRRQSGRMFLSEAMDFADKMIEYLEKPGCFKRMEKSGSLRRGVATIGDIDILAVAENIDDAVAHFTAYPDVESIIAKGTTKTSVLLKNGAQVDLRIVKNDEFGAAFVYFTGSQAHNVVIRKIAKKNGRKVSEYGVFDTSKGKDVLIASKTEEDVYKALGMQWVPPELREDRGETDAALRGELPGDLIETGHIRGDLHLHTRETDGRSGIEELVERARRKGYQYIAITDHSQLVKIANGMDEKRLLKHMDRIRKIDASVKGIKVFTGCEVDILKDGVLDVRDSVLKELDVVIAAIHSNFSLEKGLQTERILKAIDNKYVNILAHPSGRIITKRKPMEIDFEKVFARAIENNVVLEINTHGDRVDLDDVNSRRAKELGARFAINTDAHEGGQMDMMCYGVTSARRGWVCRDDVINTYSLDELVKVLKK